MSFRVVLEARKLGRFPLETWHLTVPLIPSRRYRRRLADMYPHPLGVSLLHDPHPLSPATG